MPIRTVVPNAKKMDLFMIHSLSKTREMWHCCIGIRHFIKSLSCQCDSDLSREESRDHTHSTQYGRLLPTTTRHCIPATEMCIRKFISKPCSSCGMSHAVICDGLLQGCGREECCRVISWVCDISDGMSNWCMDEAELVENPDVGKSESESLKADAGMAEDADESDPEAESKMVDAEPVEHVGESEFHSGSLKVDAETEVAQARSGRRLWAPMRRLKYWKRGK